MRIQLHIGVWCSLLGIIYAYLIPPRWDTDSYGYASAVWIATMIRTFEPHLGAALLVGAIIGLGLKTKRTAAMACVLGLILTLPTLYTALPKSTPVLTPTQKTVCVVSANLFYLNAQKAGLRS